MSALLVGLSVDHPLEMQGGLRFVSLSESPIKLVPLPLAVDTTGWSHMTMEAAKDAAVVIIGLESRPALFQPGELAPTTEKRSARYGPMEEHSLDALCEALSLACNTYVAWAIRRSENEDDVKAFGIGSPYGMEHRLLAAGAFPFGPKQQLSPEHLEGLPALFAKRLAKPNQKRGLDLAIRRWMASKRRTSNADQFIELRIALETLYLRGNRGELGFRLANYGAWHLGTDFDQRKKYQGILKKAYELASDAVHKGEVADTPKNGDVLTKAQDLCREGILRRMGEPEAPKWDDVILGKELDT